MRILITLVSMMLCWSALAHDDVNGLQDATFAGNGTWVDNDGQQGSYEVHLEFRNNVMRVDYHWPEGIITEFFTFLFANDSFDILDGEGLVVGQGTRNSFGSLTYTIDTATGHYTETIHFLSGLPGIIKEGQKRTGDRVASWREHLRNLDFVNR